jgi:hypothetical protein
MNECKRRGVELLEKEIPGAAYARALLAKVTLGITTSSRPSLSVALAFDGSTSQGRSMT